MKVLIIASHFDDEIIGCGGTLAKHIKNGDKVYVIFACGKVTDYVDRGLIEVRRKHAKKVAEIMGIEYIYIFDFPLIMLDTIPQYQIVSELEKVIFTIKPDIIYTHNADDINADHRILYEATLVWCRPSKNVFTREIYFYETFGSTIRFQPNFYVDISNEMNKKVEAMSVYTTEIEVQTRTIETICNVARYRGMEINVSYAEAFSVYRSIK